MCFLFFFFFFKQKTAYEMRISDWSSDVCSSDLRDRDDRDQRRAPGLQEDQNHQDDQQHRLEQRLVDGVDRLGDELGRVVDDVVVEAGREVLLQPLHGGDDLVGGGQRIGAGRSEEHTSELQSLMRISYAVFCLKKK